MKDDLFKLITKYAILLSILQVVALGFNRTIMEFEFNDETWNERYFRYSTPVLFNLLFNLITAYIVSQDIKKYNLQTKYVILVTIVVRPIGVFAFLLFAFLQVKHKADDIQIRN